MTNALAFLTLAIFALGLFIAVLRFARFYIRTRVGGAWHSVHFLDGAARLSDSLGGQILSMREYSERMWPMIRFTAALAYVAKGRLHWEIIVRIAAETKR